MVVAFGRAYACAALLICGCGREALQNGLDCQGVTSGDLVITEIHANPDGPDGDGEYIELYNASGSAISLEGWELVSSRLDGTGAEAHRFAASTIDPGAYWVVGNAAPEALPAHVDYSYGGTLGPLRNSDAALSIMCGPVRVDRVTYHHTIDGRALELDGELAPDGEVNDDPNHWCTANESSTELGANERGTPGAPNAPCEVPTIERECVGEGSALPLGPPQPEEAEITEWLPNPLGPDGELEWVEVRFSESVDIASVRLGTDDTTLGAPVLEGGCFPVDAGSWVVFGASPAAAPRVDADLRVSLGNDGARTLVLAAGDRILDRIEYVGSTEGVSQQRDEDGRVCEVALLPSHEFAPGNFGTPGAPPPRCPPVLQEGMCLDRGAPRPIRTPAVGQVQIVEWMANPSSVSNRDGEWVELRIDGGVDLNGLTWSDLGKVGAPLRSENCIAPPESGYAVFARNESSEENGGLPTVQGTLDISLNNSDEAISIGVGGTVLDEISYESASSGVATQVDASGVRCGATMPYGDGDLGTPGSSNGACP